MSGQIAATTCAKLDVLVSGDRKEDKVEKHKCAIDAQLVYGWGAIDETKATTFAGEFLHVATWPAQSPHASGQ